MPGLPLISLLNRHSHGDCAAPTGLGEAKTTHGPHQRAGGGGVSLLGASWAGLGGSWEGLGSLLGALGPVLGDLGSLLGDLEAVLGRSWGVLGRSWGLLARSWAVFGGQEGQKSRGPGGLCDQGANGLNPPRRKYVIWDPTPRVNSTTSQGQGNEEKRTYGTWRALWNIMEGIVEI